MDATEAVRRLGGAAPTSALLDLTTAGGLRGAVARGELERAGRGRYVLAGMRGQRRLAVQLAATLSHLSAAQQHGWALKQVPDETWVTVPRNRKVSVVDQAKCRVTYAELGAVDAVDGVTSPLRTAVDCARKLPFDEALAVADSALREGAITPDELTAATEVLRGRGARAARRVAEHADARAANPFESVLRALVIEVGTLDVVPQAPVVARGTTYHPDLVDAGRRVVVEADSWGFHGDHRAHGRDCVRHTAFAIAGWRVLRFTWEQVMHSAPYVRAVLTDLRPGPASA